jgi:hypothetical protein
MSVVTTMSVCEATVDLNIKDYSSCYRKFGHSLFFPFIFCVNKSSQKPILITDQMKLTALLASSNQVEEFLVKLMFEVVFAEKSVFVNVVSKIVNTVHELRPSFDLNAQIHMPGVETLIYKDNSSNRVHLKIHRGWFECCMLAYFESDGSVKLPVHFQIKNFSSNNFGSLRRIFDNSNKILLKAHLMKYPEQKTSKKTTTFTLTLLPEGEEMEELKGIVEEKKSTKQIPITNVTLTMIPSPSDSSNLAVESRNSTKQIPQTNVTLTKIPSLSASSNLAVESRNSSLADKSEVEIITID